jgi:hypothetical protein
MRLKGEQVEFLKYDYIDDEVFLLVVFRGVKVWVGEWELDHEDTQECHESRDSH